MISKSRIFLWPVCSRFTFLDFQSRIFNLDGGILKLADFGLSRTLGNPKQPSTPKVVTLWYRAPEILFGSRTHSSAMDMWSAGCVLGISLKFLHHTIVAWSYGTFNDHKIFKLNTAELLQHQALFPARGETELFDQIINTIGSPNESIWPGFNKLPFFQMYSLKEMSFCFMYVLAFAYIIAYANSEKTVKAPTI